MSSLRDLMKREKDSRKRNLTTGTSEGSLKKITRISQPEDNKVQETPPTLNKPEDPLPKPTVSFTLPETPKVIEESYELVEEEDTPKEVKVEEVKKRGNDDNVKTFDNTTLVYEQLNTAFCSNIDYEYDNILKDSGIEPLEINEDYDSQDEQEDLNAQLMSKHTITSSNFGASSNIKVSTNENLPIGFFDDKNIDAKARGKLTLKEARAKIDELSKKRSAYLREAKYVQEKFIESYREQIRLENDQLDHEETVKELKVRISAIKNIIAKDAPCLDNSGASANTNSVNTEVKDGGSDNLAEGSRERSLQEEENLDSWRCRSLL